MRMSKRKISLRNVAMIACLVTITVFSGCKKDPVTNPDNPDNPTGTTMVNMELKGIVNDINGNPLSGVKVITGTKSANTGADGTFSFTQAEEVNNRVIVKLEKSGYFSLVRSGEKADGMYIKAVLTPKGNTANSLQTTFDAAAGVTLQVAGAKVVIAPSGIMKKDGSAYSGTVKVDMRYLDPYTKNFSAMMSGGNHAGKNKAGEEVILISVGIIGVELTDNQNNPLQLKSGSPAEVTYPIPAGMSGALPATIPISTFDEQKGIWVEETVATLQGGVYVGQVTHFSDKDLAPLDTRPETRILRGRVIDCDGQPISGAGVFVDASWNRDELEDASPLEFILRTNNKGEWSVRVPKSRGIKMLAAWTNFANDDEYTEKYTIESGDDGIVYVSKLCNEGEGWLRLRSVEYEYEKAMWQPNNTSLMIFNINDAPNSGDYVIINFKNVPAKLPPGTYTYTNGLNQITSFGIWINDEIILAPWVGLGCTLTLEKNASDNTYSVSFSGTVTFFDAPGKLEPFELFFKGKINGLD